MISARVHARPSRNSWSTAPAPEPLPAAVPVALVIRTVKHTDLHDGPPRLLPQIVANFCLTLGRSAPYVPPMATTPLAPAPTVGQGAPAPAAQLRVGIVGTGFMAGVHARAALVAGARVHGVVGSRPESGERFAGSVGARGYADLDALLADVDVVHVCTPNHTHRDLSVRALEAGRHGRVREAARDGARRRAGDGRGRGRGGWRPCRSSTASTRWCARRGPGSARGELGRLGTVHGTLPAGLALPRRRRQLARRPRARWRLPRVRRHRLALVRPRRVRHRRPASTRLSARTRTVRPDRGGSAVSTEDVVTVQFVTAAGVLGNLVVSQVAAGRKNRLLPRGQRHRRLGRLRPGGARGAVGRPPRGVPAALCAIPRCCLPDAARLSRLPAGHAQGYQDCFDSLRRRHLRRRPRRAARRAADLRRRRRGRRPSSTPCSPPRRPTAPGRRWRPVTDLVKGTPAPPAPAPDVLVRMTRHPQVVPRQRGAARRRPRGARRARCTPSSARTAPASRP